MACCLCTMNAGRPAFKYEGPIQGAVDTLNIHNTDCRRGAHLRLLAADPRVRGRQPVVGLIRLIGPCLNMISGVEDRAGAIHLKVQGGSSQRQAFLLGSLFE